MRLLRALASGLLLLLVLALIAAWVVPPRLDLDTYRADIARVAGARIGRRVHITGPIAFRLLPEPTLSAAGISVAPPGAGVSITAAELRLRLALGPLLGGRIDARDVVLRGAELVVPWPIDPAALTWRTPHWLAAFSARIEDGRLRIGGLAFTGIEATLATDALTGTYAAAGLVHLSGQAWRFTARLTQPGRDGSAALDVTLDGQGRTQGIGGALTGQIGPDGSFGGRVSGRGPNLALLVPAPPVAFQAEGRVTVAGGLAAADDLALQIGGSPAQGAVALRVTPAPRLDIALAASRLDLDAWLQVLARPASIGLPTGIDLSAEAASFAGGTLRGLRAAVDLSPAGATLREARALLPGDAPVRLSGRVLPGLHFEGDVSLAAPSLRTTLAWVEQAGMTPLAGLPAGVLRTATLAAHVVADPSQVALGDLDAEIDGAHVAGSLTVRGGKRLTIGAGLVVERLDLDPWLGAAPGDLAALPARFAGFDLDLRLEARQAVLRGVTFAPLALDAAAEGGQLNVRKLDVQMSGVHASASVSIGAGGRVAEGRLDMQAAQAGQLAPLLPDRFGFLARRAPGLWRAAAAAQVLGSGTPGSLALKITADLADLRLEAQPTLDLTTGIWKAPLTLRHPGAPRLLEALGVTSAPAWLGDGSLGLVAQLSGAPDRLAADDFTLTAGGLHATGALLLDAAGKVPTLTGHIAAETLPLPVPDPRAPEPLPFAALAGWGGTVQVQAGRVLANQLPVLADAAATLTLADGKLTVADATAKLGGGMARGDASLDAGAAPPTLALHLKVAGAQVGGKLFDLPLDLSGGTLDAQAALTAAGHSPAALLATLGGAIGITVRDGTLAGVALDKVGSELSEDAVRAALAGGSTKFTTLDLTARAAEGVLSIAEGRMVAPAGDVTIAGSIDLPDQAADLRLALRPAVPDPPTIGLRLTGPRGAIRRIPELADLPAWRSAHPAAGP